MKRMIVAGWLILFANIVQAQTFDEWFKQKQTQIRYLVEQIAALQVNNGLIHKGYDIADLGLTNIFKSKEGDYSQHSNYFLSLWKVKASISENPKIPEVYAMKEFVQQQQQLVNGIPAGSLHPQEREYIKQVYENLLIGCRMLVTEMELVTRDDQLQLKDDERMQRIDKIYDEMQDRYTFCRAFTNEVKLLVKQVLTAQQDVNGVSSLIDIK